MPQLFQRCRIHVNLKLPCSKLLRRLLWLLGIRREDIVGLYGTICRALPPDLAEQFKSLDTTDGIRVTLRTGETFWFRPNTTVKAIVAHIVEETSLKAP